MGKKTNFIIIPGRKKTDSCLEIEKFMYLGEGALSCIAGESKCKDFMGLL